MLTCNSLSNYFVKMKNLILKSKPVANLFEPRAIHSIIICNSFYFPAN